MISVVRGSFNHCTFPFEVFPVKNTLNLEPNLLNPVCLIFYYFNTLITLFYACWVKRPNSTGIERNMIKQIDAYDFIF